MTTQEILSKLPERQLLDNDLYKMSMLWFVMNYYPDAIVTYEFVDRRNYKYPIGLGDVLRKRIDGFRDMKLSKEHRKAFQDKCPYLPNLFFDFLMGYRLDPSNVSIFQENDGTLRIKVSGYWYAEIFWEIILMSEISEINFLMTGEKPTETRQELKKKNIEKANILRMNDIQFMDFGTRRRYSFENQKNVIKDLIEGGGNKFVGTSNVLFAIENNIKCLGSMAHEIICAVAAEKGYSHANRHILQMWSKLYNGNCGTMLTDSFGIQSFLNDFDSFQARTWDSVRHDSGDPFKFADRIIEHYTKLGIDPKSKTIIFSDGLDISTTIKIADYCRGKIKTSFGIGTHFTNDLVGIKPLNIVIKLFSINDKEVIKLSDFEGKHTGDKRTIELVKEMIKYKPL